MFKLREAFAVSGASCKGGGGGSSKKGKTKLEGNLQKAKKASTKLTGNLNKANVPASRRKTSRLTGNL